MQTCPAQARAKSFTWMRANRPHPTSLRHRQALWLVALLGHLPQWGRLWEAVSRVFPSGEGGFGGKCLHFSSKTDEVDFLQSK